MGRWESYECGSYVQVQARKQFLAREIEWYAGLKPTTDRCKIGDLYALGSRLGDINFKDYLIDQANTCSK